MKLDPKEIPALLFARLRILARYRVILFFVFLVALYGYLVLQINNATNAQPSSGGLTSAQASPHIDPKVVDQLKQLQDNSVSVKALFNQAHTNPFQ